MEAYPYGTGSTVLAAAFFREPDFEARNDPESAAEAYVRLIGYAGATGAHMHICHFNSSSKTDIERCAVLVETAQRLRWTQPRHGRGGRRRCSGRQNFARRNGTGLGWRRLGDCRRFRDREELLAAQAEEPSTLVLWHILDTENNAHHRALLDISVLYPGGAIASDAMPWSLPDGSVYTDDAWPLPNDATSHPRSAGCFTRFIRHWVRERQAVSLLEGVRKCALIPADILAPSTPAMRAKGRLTPSADADVVVTARGGRSSRR